MKIRRYCGHYEQLEDPETKEQFLMERGRRCTSCKRNQKSSGERTVLGKFSKSFSMETGFMEMVADLWNE